MQPKVILLCLLVIAGSLGNVGCASSVRYSSTVSTGKESNADDNIGLGSRMSRLIEAAESWLGTPYLFGGNSRRGIDCSALMVNVFREVGLHLPRSSREQFATGSSISKASLAAGDLVFFNTSGKGVSHVGLYVGRGNFIHASSSRGVVRESLGQPYYRQHFLGARRIR